MATNSSSVSDKFTGEDIASLFQKWSLPVYELKLEDTSGLPLAFSDLIFKPSCQENKLQYLSNFIDEIDYNNADIKEAIQRFNSGVSDENLKSLKIILEKEQLPEKDLLVGLGIHVIEKFTGSASTSEAKGKLKCPCGCKKRLSTAPMYIGSKETWHGELDLISGNAATNISVTTSTDVVRRRHCDSNSSEEGSESPESDGDRTNVEVKIETLRPYQKNFCQVIGQSIVFGFTEYNRHPDYSPYIPSILIDGRKFYATIYNPVADFLFISAGAVHYFPFEQEKHYGLFNIWVILNHRLFFTKDESNLIMNEKSGFQSHLAEKLHVYNELKEYSINISQALFDLPLSDRLFTVIHGKRPLQKEAEVHNKKKQKHTK